MSRPLITFLILVLFACLLPAISVPCSEDECPVSNSSTAQSTVSVSIEPSQPLVRQTIQVAAHQALQYNFALTTDTALFARFQVEGGANNSIRVLLLDEANYQRYLSHQKFSYFEGTSGSVHNTGSYIVRVPQNNIYHVILDNSGAWLLPRNVHLYIYSILPSKSPEVLASEKTMSDNFSKLGEMFVFPSFRLEVKHCGTANAFSNPNITICTEMVEELTDKHLEQAVSFVFFHELGHTLLRGWGYPLWDNEDAADQFATFMLILSKKQQEALQAAQFWASLTSQQEALSKLWVDDRHTVSPQRARNIIKWLNRQNLELKTWSQLVVPHMQTSALQNSLKDVTDPIDKDAIRKELKSRGCPN